MAADSVRKDVIVREGARRIIASADRTWDDFFDDPGFDLGDREQPEAQRRYRL